MRRWDFSRYAPASCVALALVAGCGGAQPPAGAFGVMPQQTAPSGKPKRPGHRRYLYVAEQNEQSGAFQTDIRSFPDDGEVGVIPNFGDMCEDTSGNVYITSYSSVTEYAAGSLTAKAQAQFPNETYGADCTVDPTTGDIAVGGTERLTSSSRASWLAIYPGSLSDAPAIYSNAALASFSSCAYDGSGNLFLDGDATTPPYSYLMTNLPRGSAHFTNLNAGNLAELPLQWDGSYITAEAGSGRPATIYRLSFSGSSVSIVGETHLNDYRGGAGEQISWIQGALVVKAYHSPSDELGIWRYPQGGAKPYKLLRGFEHIFYPLVSPGSK